MNWGRIPRPKGEGGAKRRVRCTGFALLLPSEGAASSIRSGRPFFQVRNYGTPHPTLSRWERDSFTKTKLTSSAVTYGLLLRKDFFDGLIALELLIPDHENAVLNLMLQRIHGTWRRPFEDSAFRI